MPNKILIIEGDAALSSSIRSAAEAKGFEAQESSDGKRAPDLIRSARPDLVLLAVDLPAGQNGYILCGKLKKDDDLKAVPIIIIGNPDGFAQHRKLKTHADDYVAKPLEPDALVERIGALIGFPEAAAPEVDESLSLSDLVEVEEAPADEESTSAEEIALDAGVEATVQGDPELDMLDAAFDDISTTGASAAGEDLDPPPPPDGMSEEVEISALNDIGEEISEEDPNEKTQIGLPSRKAAAAEAQPEAVDEAIDAPAPPPAESPRASYRGAGGDASELRELRARLSQLEGALQDAEARANEQEARVRALESELESKSTELEASRGGGGKSDKELFALKDAATKKDKEILRLKSELNEKEKELVELQDRLNQIEQQASEGSGELARRDAQIKTLTGKVDQLTSEKRRAEQQASQAKDEARAAQGRVAALESELTAAQERAAAADEAEQLRAELDRARQEAEDTRAQLETQLTTQATAFAEEAASLRRRINEMEESTAKNEERASKLYARIKGEEKLRDKTKKALSIALQLLDEQAASGDETNDEEATA